LLKRLFYPAESIFSVLSPGGRAHTSLKQIAAVQVVSDPGTIIVIHHSGMSLIPLFAAMSTDAGSITSDCGMSHVSDRDVKDLLMGLAPEDEDEIEASKFGEITTE
jgi:carbonic anhydrase